MALTIKWTKRAAYGFDEIIRYLQFNFTEREVKSFIKELDDFLELLSLYPELLAASISKSNVHRGPVNKFTILTYRVNYEKGIIELINLRASRKKPM